MLEKPDIAPFGDRGIVINFGESIDEYDLINLLWLKNILQENFVKHKVEVINTYNSLSVIYPVTIDDVYNEILTIKSLISQANISKNIDSSIHEIPVCYEGSFGLDLEHISQQKNLSIPEIISLHTSPEYLIYFIGFLPGFMYLGGLDPKLNISRKKTPRREVEKGSVGIGENQTGIYPKNSPGGWQILGKSPLNFFDKNSAIPTPFSAGDKIKFKSISIEEFSEIKDLVKEDKFQIKTWKNEG